MDQLVKRHAYANGEAISGVNIENAEQQPRQGRESEEYFLTDEVNNRLKYLQHRQQYSLSFGWKTVLNFILQEIELSLTNRATHLCKYQGVADLLKTRPSHAEFGRSALKDVGIDTGELPKIGERWNSALLG